MEETGNAGVAEIGNEVSAAKTAEKTARLAKGKGKKKTPRNTGKESVKVKKAVSTSGLYHGKSPGVRQVAEVYKLVSDPGRLAVVLNLLEGPMAVNAVSESLGMSQPSVSHHLSLLKASHLVDAVREGKNVFYSLNPAVKSFVAAAAKLVASSAEVASEPRWI